MNENIHAKPVQELNDDQLEQVSGGDYNTEFLNETRVPGHWIVTCVRCAEQFTVHTNKRCPFCGNAEVSLDYSRSRPYFDCAAGQWRK